MPDLGFPSRFAHLTEFELRPDQLGDFKEAATRIATAYNRMVGIHWAAYSTYAGSSTKVYVLIPLQILDQLDEIPAVDEVLLHEYGEAGGVFLRDYQQAVASVGTSILVQLPDLEGRPAGPDPRMPGYVYYTKLLPRQGDGERFHAAAGRVAQAHRQHPEGLTWYSYGTLAGDPCVHRWQPLYRLGELSMVQETTRIVQEVLGPEPGAEVLGTLQSAVVDSRSAVLQYLGHYPG
jgi:hypothetical protein